MFPHRVAPGELGGGRALVAFGPLVLFYLPPSWHADRGRVKPPPDRPFRSARSRRTLSLLHRSRGTHYMSGHSSNTTAC